MIRSMLILVLISFALISPTNAFESYDCSFGNSLKVDGSRAVLNGQLISFGQPARSLQTVAAFLSRRSRLSLIPVGSLIWAEPRSNGTALVFIEGRTLRCR